MLQTRHKLSFFFLSLILTLTLTSATPGSLLFSSFFAEKNLSSSNITCFFQDSKGYMWIGTEDGLNYFNGKTIRVFKHDYQDINSLPDNVVLTVCEDKEGSIWIGTSRGVAKLNPDLLTFENYSSDDGRQPLGYKLRTYVDKENQVWAVADGSIYSYNKRKNVFRKRRFTINSGFKNKIMPYLFTGIFEDSKHNYWVSCNDNLYQYFPNDDHFELFSNLEQPLHFFPVQEDAKGNLYCGTWNGGLYRINLKSKSLETLENPGLYNCYVVQTLKGRPVLWYGNKLSGYDLQEGSIFNNHNNVNDPYSAKNDEVSALYVDSQNQLWIGYGKKGVQIMSPSNQIFKTYSISKNENDFPTVHCLIKTERYDYIGGWYNHSLVRLDKTHKPVKTWKTLLPGVYDHENNISSAWSDKHGNIWFTSSPGLICFNEATEKAKLFKLDTAVSRRSHLLTMIPEGDSVLWIAGYFCGLSRFSLNTKTFQNWGAHQNELFWDLTKDNTGMLWLANNTGALTSFDYKTKTFTNKRYDELTEGAIYRSVLFDSINNIFWIATDNGLLRVDRKNFVAKLFTEKDNLPTNQVNALQFDSHRRLWIATNKGLCFYEPGQNVCKTFFSNNGLPDNMLAQMFSMQPNDELYIGCRDGFSVLKTNAIPHETFSPAVRINRVYESGKIIPLENRNFHKVVDLAYNQNNIQIEFSSNDLINSEDNQLLFKLEGFDGQWRTAQNGIVDYNKLSPGKYLFHVSVISHTGQKPKHDDFLSIIVHPPFWKTWWFLVLMTFCVLGIMLFVARYIFTRNLREKILILEKEQAIEKERNRISQDMHDELGSGLTKISIMSEVAMMQLMDPLKAKNQLENISASSRGLVDNLQDIIWILNSRHGSLENLCAYLREYALKYFEPFDMQVEIDFPEKISSVKLSEDQRRNILLVFKESFNNISKHSSCRQIQIKMSGTDGIISFTIHDNGKGFDKSAIRSFANGLQNMERRMTDINGTFTINSVMQRGTTSEFTFSL